MNSDIIQFQCQSCHSTLTVPAQLAGVTGPCPHCGQTVTSPQATPPPQPAPSAFIPAQPPVMQPAPQAPVQPQPMAAPAWGAPPTPQPQSPGPASAPPWASAPSTTSASPAPQAAAPAVAGTQPVMPLPNAFPQFGGAPSGMPAPQPQQPAANLPPAQAFAPQYQEPTVNPPPAWQTPPPVAAAQPQPAPMNALGQNPGAPAFGGAPSLLGGLPPKRPEGQSPATSSLIGGGTSNAWGAPLAAGRDAGMSAGGMAQPGMPGAAGPSHSQLIPGSPALPSLHSGNAESFGSLLAKKAPPSPMAGQTGIAGGMEDETAFAPAGATPRLSGSDPRGAGRRLSTRKPKRGSNLMMFALAVVFLLGFLAVAGWLLRDQVTVLVNRFIPGRVPTGTSHAGVEIPSLPTKPDSGKPSSDSIPVKDSLPPPETAATADKDQVATSTPESAKPAFDPTEPEPRKAMPATPDEVAAATTNAPSSTFPTPSDLPAVPAPPPSTAGGLVEVPPKAVIASLNNGTTAPSNTENLMPSSDKGLQIKASPEAQPAGEALRQFLMAGSLEERLKYTLAADEMQPLMERYYTHNSAGSIPVDLVGLVRFDPKPQVGAGAHAVFGVESKTWQYPVPVMLEETSSGFKVDWLSFVEFKDRMLEKFFQGYQEGPARFHVGIKRYHHFDDGIPNSDDKHSFEVTPAPPNPFKASVFVDKDSNLGLELVDKIPWGTGVWAIVELQWMKKGDREWVELAAVPQTNWYSVPATAPKAAPAPPEKEVPKPPRARPAGR